MPPLLSLLAVAVALAAAAGGQAARYDDPGVVVPCRSSRSSLPCGGRVDVHYPFHLADDSEGRPYCGYPGMAVTCDDGGRGAAVLSLHGHDYTVLDIDYGGRTVVVADSEVLASGGACPRVTHNVTVPPGTPLSVSPAAAAANANLTFFLDCASTAPPPSGAPINCSSFPRGPPGSVSFVVPQQQQQQQQQQEDAWWPAAACKTVVVAPVLRHWLLSPEHLACLADDGYGQVLKQGFQLAWDPSSGPCDACEQTKGMCSHSQKGEFIGCFSSDGNLRYPDCGLGSSEKKAIAYIALAVAGSLLLSLLLFICALCRKKFQAAIMSCKWGSRCTSTIESFLQEHDFPQPKRYTYSEVKTMTKSFAHKLGKGGFGIVYKGSLPNGREVAVKVLKNSKDDGMEFMNEVASIMRTSHVNIVTLLGYCLQGSKRALIYEYMPNGSLERFTFGQNSEVGNSLSWDKLFDIIVGIARGLEYLHQGCNTHIVHFDIKPHNILLDQDFCPKISDFGLAKFCMEKESTVSIHGARGTIGYIAPEVFAEQDGQVSAKSDVYSFGMMILEMVGARNNNVNNSSETSSKYFPQWVYEQLEEYCVNAGEISADSDLVRKLIIVGLWCIQMQPNNRPSMTRVIEMLETRSYDLQIPPQSLLC